MYHLLQRAKFKEMLNFEEFLFVTGIRNVRLERRNFAGSRKRRMWKKKLQSGLQVTAIHLFQFRCYAPSWPVPEEGNAPACVYKLVKELWLDRQFFLELHQLPTQPTKMKLVTDLVTWFKVKVSISNLIFSSSSWLWWPAWPLRLFRWPSCRRTCSSTKAVPTNRGNSLAESMKLSWNWRNVATQLRVGRRHQSGGERPQQADRCGCVRNGRRGQFLVHGPRRNGRQVDVGGWWERVPAQRRPPARGPAHSRARRQVAGRSQSRRKTVNCHAAPFDVTMFVQYWTIHYGCV